MVDFIFLKVIDYMDVRKLKKIRRDTLAFDLVKTTSMANIIKRNRDI